MPFLNTLQMLRLTEAYLFWHEFAENLRNKRRKIVETAVLQLIALYATIQVGFYTDTTCKTNI